MAHMCVYWTSQQELSNSIKLKKTVKIGLILSLEKVKENGS